MKTSFENFKDDILSVQKDTNFWTGNLSDRWSIGKENLIDELIESKIIAEC